MRSWLAALPLFTILAACQIDGEGGQGDANRGAAREVEGQGGGFVDGGAGGGGLPSGACGKMDILFVIDDSTSMVEEQKNLAENFPKFVEAIDAFRSGDGKPLDYRIAVTTPSRDLDLYTFSTISARLRGENGAFRSPAACGMKRPWLERGDPDLAATFACVAQVGTDGSGIEMPLEAMKLALSDRIADGTNGAFLRDDALLAIVILTDENDCSIQGTDAPDIDIDVLCRRTGLLTNVDGYLTFLDGLKKDRGRWAASVIAGPQQCSSVFGNARNATRLTYFANSVGKTGRFSSICEGDLSISLREALETFDGACREFPALK